MTLINFKQGIHRHQAFLVMKRPEDYLPNDHLARVVDQIIDEVDTSELEAKYSFLGQNAYHPKMMVKLLYYSYSNKISSSRTISKNCETHLDLMFLTNNLTPSHDRISNFRRENSNELNKIFEDIVLIGVNLGIVKLNNVRANIDGVKIKACASSKLSKDETCLDKLSEKIKSQIKQMMKEAESKDNAEDSFFGENQRGDELNKKLKSKQSRYDAIKRAKKELLVRKDKLRKALLKKRNNDNFDNLTKTQENRINSLKINTTDNDANFMKERNGTIRPNYNGQLSVDEETDFILAADVTTDCNDTHQLNNMVVQTIKNLKTKPKKVNADNGYHPELELVVKKYPEINFYIDDKEKRNEEINLEKLKKKYSEIQYNNLIKLLSEKGKIEYSTRMHTVESVNGNIKENLGFRSFRLRGLDKVKSEFKLISTVHNIKKIASHISKLGTNLALALLKSQINVNSTSI